MVRSAAAALALAVSVLGLTACAQEMLLLDFSSPNCVPCHQMEPIIDNFAKAGYPVRKVDVTREQQLAAQFNVTRYPTFVMLAGGREIDRIVGACPGERIQALYQKAQQVVRVAPQVKSLDNTEFRGQNLDPPRPVARQAIASPQAALLNATVRLRVDDGQIRSFGTGTIIDARKGEALIITCGHLFRDSQGKAPFTVELFEAMPDGVRVADQFAGEFICYDLDRDVALVCIRPNRKVTVAPVAAVRTNIQRGDRVISIGCSNGQDPSVLETRVTHLDRYQGAPNLEASGAPAIGRSGGGLFNTDGQLIGICNAADEEGNEGLYAPLESIHDELAKLGLNLDDAKKTAAATPPGNSPAQIARGQEPKLESVQPVPAYNVVPATPVASNDAAPAPSDAQSAELGPVEQAGWEELLARAAKSEVVIIVRPKEPGGKSEIIELDNVSPEFIRRLDTLQRAAKPSTVRY